MKINLNRHFSKFSLNHTDLNEHTVVLISSESLWVRAVRPVFPGFSASLYYSPKPMTFRDPTVSWMVYPKCMHVLQSFNEGVRKRLRMLRALFLAKGKKGKSGNDHRIHWLHLQCSCIVKKKKIFEVKLNSGEWVKFWKQCGNSFKIQKVWFILTFKKYLSLTLANNPLILYMIST